MPDFAWFGYPALERSVLAWGTRAIFHPNDKYPLDILWDRQGHKFNPDTQRESYRQFADFINKAVLPDLQELSRSFSPSDDDKFVCHFDWPQDSRLVAVATGSPNGSYGYFYISVNLIAKEHAPEVLLPCGYVGRDAEKPKKAKSGRRRGR